MLRNYLYCDTLAIQYGPVTIPYHMSSTSSRALKRGCVMPRRPVLGPCPCRPSIVTKTHPRFSLFFFLPPPLSLSLVRYEPWVRHAGGLLTTVSTGRLSVQTGDTYLLRRTLHPPMDGTRAPSRKDAASVRTAREAQWESAEHHSNDTLKATCDPKASCSKCVQLICTQQSRTTY